MMNIEDIDDRIINEGNAISAGMSKFLADEIARDILEKNNIPATVRISMGSDIGGACGQLRRKHK